MNLLDNPLLRRTLAPHPDDLYAEPRKRLLNALLQMRDRAKMLAGEIHRDLPDFTVHDITHLDALWEMADLIAGPDYPLNPLEAFALGAVFLLHDLGLGLAAYPGGLAELKKGPGWQDALSTELRKHLKRIPTVEEFASPKTEVEREAVRERLRALHAEQAERLALASWSHGGGPEYHLIDDPDLRLAIGSLLGKIAHSHWWPVSRLGNEFGTIRGALTSMPKCPPDWTLDPLKVAVLLRTADAAHLDERRAPGFLIALRRPEGLSKEHWRFQNHLLKPQIDNDRLIYTTNRPFPTEEVNDWWLCEETLRTVDRELRQVDALLADRGSPPRLRARGVAGIESSDRLQKYIEVSGWTPVDARIHVSSVSDLVRRLGGEQLYGNDPTVPLRELIQNASDAVRARRVLQKLPNDWGRITVRLGRDDAGPWIEIEDTGIGMSEEVLKGSLLDFGTTYWDSALMREEHGGLWGEGFEPTGRFGIGFFSVFIWGERVSVATRRYKEDAQKDTRILEFRTGLTVRPLIRPAIAEEQLLDGGTKVRVYLIKEPGEKGGLLFPMEALGRNEPVELGKLCSWLAPALDVDLFVEAGNEASRVVAASDWLTIGVSDLLSRISIEPLAVSGWYSDLVVVVEGPDRRPLGRASVYHGLGDYLGVSVIGGLRSEGLLGVAGIFLGSAGEVTRNSANLLVKGNVLRNWATSQGRIIEEKFSESGIPLGFAGAVLRHGGDPGSLPIAVRQGEYLDFESIANWENPPGEIAVIPVQGLFPEADLYPHVLETTTTVASTKFEASRSILGYIIEAVAKAFQCASEEVKVVETSHYDVGLLESGVREVSMLSVYLLRRPSRRSDKEKRK